jgi:perosamine synthetase
VTAVCDASSGVDGAAVAAALAAVHAATRPFFPPLSSLPAFADATDRARAAGTNPVAYDLARRGINLPSPLSLDEEQVDRVCQAVRSLLEHGAVPPIG